MGKYDALFEDDTIAQPLAVPKSKYAELFVDDEPQQQPNIPPLADMAKSVAPVQHIWTKGSGALPDVKQIPKYVSENVKNVVKAPYETLFPTSAAWSKDDKLPLVGNVPGGKYIKGNVGTLIDMLSSIDRGVDFLSGGAFSSGQQSIAETAQKIPIKGTLGDIAKGLVTGVGSMVAPSTVIGGGTIKNILRSPVQKAQEKMLQTVLAKPNATSKIAQTAKKHIVNEAGEIGIFKNADDVANSIINGVDVVEDIEQVVSPAAQATPVQPVAPQTYKQIEMSTNPAFKPTKRLGVIPTGMDDIEAFALAVPEEPGTIPFTAYAEQAIKAKPRIDIAGNPVPTALDAIGAREVEAMDRLNKVISEVGKAKGELVQKAASTASVTPWGETVGLVDTRPIKEVMENEVREKLGATVGMGYMEGLPQRISSKVNKDAVDEMASIINQLPHAATVQETDDAIRRLFELKQSMEGGVSTRFAKSPDSQRLVVDRVRSAAKDALDEHIATMLSEEDAARFRGLNQSYANLVKNRDYAQRRIGALVGDIDDQQLARGAGVARAAVANNSDMGTKAMFSFLKKYTGIDLYREATYAWLATKAAGDERGISLIEAGLKGSGAIKGTPMGIVGAGSAAMKLIQGNKMKTLVDYYNKMQKKGKLPSAPQQQQSLLDLARSANNRLGQSGAVGGVDKIADVPSVQTVTGSQRAFEIPAIYDKSKANSAVSYISSLSKEIESLPDNIKSQVEYSKVFGGLVKKGIEKTNDIDIYIKIKNQGSPKKNSEMIEAIQDWLPQKINNKKIDYSIESDAGELSMGAEKGLGINFYKNSGAVGGVNPQVKSENFKKWFGDWEKNSKGPMDWYTDDTQSKVVDDLGRPLVVYHGTKSNFTKFDPKMSGKNTAKIGGRQPEGTAFFSDKPDVAQSYSGQHTDFAGNVTLKDNSNIMPVYLDIKKPLEIYADGAGWQDITYKGKQYTTNELADYAKSKGYDGLILHELFDVGEGISKPSTVYATFSDNQIKSATGNSGAFSPTNPDIRGNSAMQTLGGMAGGSAAGGAAGSQIGDTPEERRRNALIGMGIGAAAGPTALAAMAKGGRRLANQSGIIGPDVAKKIKMPVNLPKDETAITAIKNTPGAQITEDGILLDVSRFQKPEQAAQTSVRTGVFYLPQKNSSQKTLYTRPSNLYGGKQEISGQTLVKNPIIVKGATGGKVPEAAYDIINGKGAYETMRGDVLKAIMSWGSRVDESKVANVLEKYGANPDMAYEIIQNSKGGNLLAYAIQENIVAHSVRKSGHDAVIGYSIKSKTKEPYFSELFDVREADYPDVDGYYRLNDDIETGNTGLQMLGGMAGAGVAGMTLAGMAKNINGKKKDK